RKNRAKRPARSNRRLRASRRFQIVSSTCPACRSKEVTPTVEKARVKCRKPRVKRALDLVFTSGGIKRRVIECRTSVHQCLRCGHAFVPARHERLDKHFHGLKSWAMFQHVAHRLSFATIQTM